MNAGERTVLVGILAALFTAHAIGQLLRNPHARDFAVFYDSGRSVDPSADLSRPDAVRPNLNSPILTGAVFAPLSWMSLRTAAVVWTVIGAVVLILSTRAIARELSLSTQQTILAIGAMLLLPGAHLAWQEGQPSWLLLYPMTRAWIAYRRAEARTAGAWLALVIAAKPLFAPAALVLGLGVLWVAALGTATLIGAAVAIQGVDPWVEWVRLSDRVSWLWYVMNASVPGVLARVVSPDPFQPIRVTDFSLTATLAWVGVAVAMLVATATIQTRRWDAKWVSALLACVLISPLGWTYYMPLVLGAGVAWWRARHRSWWHDTIVWANWVPIVLVAALVRGTPSLFPYLGSLYSGALFGTWVIVTVNGHTRIEHQP